MTGRIIGALSPLPGIADGSGSGSRLASYCRDQSARRRRLSLAQLLGLALVLAFAPQVDAAESRVIRIRPGENYRAALRDLRLGDELVFLPGVHEGSAVLEVAGTPEKPIVIRGEVEGGRRAELRLSRRGNLWRIQGKHLVIRDLDFQAARGYAIRVGRGEGIVIENCVFTRCSGGAISANSANVNGLRISSCRFLEIPVTPVYIGNHDGNLDVRNFVFERNAIDGSKIHSSGIGYGIQLKLNVRGGIIRENLITGTQGPGIMVYGARDARPEDASLVEGNIIIGSRNSAGIVVGGGPAIVRNNLVLGCRGGGISLENYGGRNLLDQITLSNNLAAGNSRHDFSFSRSVTALVAAGNRAWRTSPGDGFSGLPRSTEGGDNRTVIVDDVLRQFVDPLAAGTLPSHEALAPVWEQSRTRPWSAADHLTLEETLAALSHR